MPNARRRKQSAAKRHTKRSKSATDASAPWNRSKPKPRRRTKHLTKTQKHAAKRAARKAGRPYPNLVDNMRAAKSG